MKTADKQNRKRQTIQKDSKNLGIHVSYAKTTYFGTDVPIELVSLVASSLTCILFITNHNITKLDFLFHCINQSFENSEMGFCYHRNYVHHFIGATWDI